MSVSKVIKNSLWFGVIPKLSTLINVIILPIITPYLSAYDMGIWGVITGYVGIFTSISSLGLYVHLTNSYYEYGRKFYFVWSRLLALILVASAICSAVLIFILFISLDTLTLLRRLVVSILAVFPVLFGANVLLAQHLYPQRETPKKLVLKTLAASLSGVFVSFILIYYYRAGYMGFVGGAAVNTIIGFVLFIKPLWFDEKIKPSLRIGKKRLVSWLKISFPAIPHALGFILLSSTARIVMDMFNLPIDDIGIYTNGYTIGSYISIITVAVLTAISPQIQIAYRTNDLKHYRQLYYFSQALCIIAIVSFVIWMPEIYSILIRNKELSESMWISQLICFVNAVFPLYSFMSGICFIEKKTSKLLWLVFLPGFLNILLCVIFIPYFGYKTAIFTTLISYWTQIFIPVFIKYFKIQVFMWLGSLWKLLLLLVILFSMMAFSLFASHLDILYKSILSFICICGIVKYLKYCSYKHIV